MSQRTSLEFVPFDHLRRPLQASLEMRLRLDRLAPVLPDLVECVKLISPHIQFRFDRFDREVEAYALVDQRVVVLTPLALQASDGRLAALVAHEDVHVCTGEELDAEAVEQNLFPEYATAPDRSDLQAFLRLPAMNGGRWRRGRFVAWNPASGEVRTLDLRFIIARFQPLMLATPTPSYLTIEEVHRLRLSMFGR